MKFSTTFGAMAQFAYLSAASLFYPELGAGNITYSTNDTNFLAAVQSPNITKSVTFDYDLLTSADATWTWRVNISEVSVPDQNSTTAFTTYDLQWPSGGTINEARNALHNESSSAAPTLACAYVVTGTLLEKAGRNWDASNGTDCSSALGQACVSAIQNGFTTRSGNTCPYFPNFDTLDECSDYFNITGTGNGYTSAFGYGIANSTAASSTTYTEGEGFFYSTSELVVPGNDTLYEDALSTLQLLVILDQQVNMMCQRVGNASDTSGASSRVGFSLSFLMSAVLLQAVYFLI